jgi:endoglucanase
MDNIEVLLKELTEASGIAGFESEVRGLIRRHFEPFGELDQDRLGSLICRKKGSSDKPVVMLAGHMDEIGFMVRYITEKGFIRFVPLGGWWDHVLLAQRVKIETSSGDVIGIFGAKPPHILSEEERKKMVDKDSMYIDIGATSQEEVEKAGVRIGDPIIPISEFTILANPKTYLAKAFDDRVGCAVAIAVMQKLAGGDHPNTLVSVATAQEEVGLRGAKTSVEVVDPDVALVLEGGIAADVPGVDREGAPKFGGGPIVSFMEARMIANLKLRDLVVDVAKKADIPIQIVASAGGGATDGAVIHLHRSGIPTIVVSTAARHIHSHTSILHRDDFDRAVDLVARVVQALDKDTVADMTSW